MSQISQAQTDAIEKLYSLCFTMNQPLSEPLADGATLTYLADSRPKLEINSSYSCDSIIGYYLYNILDTTNQKFEYVNGD
jgi:hypothetical protein